MSKRYRDKNKKLENITNEQNPTHINNNINNKQVEDSLEKRKSLEYAEDIYIKILEDNISKLSDDLINIRQKEQEHIEDYINKYKIQKEELEKEYDILKNNLEKDKEKIIEHYNQKEQESIEQKEEIKKEYEIKTKEIENNYKKLNENLEEEYRKKFEKLDLEYKEKNDNLEEEYNAKMAFLEDYEKDIEETNQEKYKELMKKVADSSAEFETFMKKQRDLFQEEIRLKNLERDEELKKLNEGLLAKEKEINDSYNEKLMELKQSELELVSKETELNTKISKLNKNVEEFNNNKQKFIKRHYLTRRFISKIKKHKIKFIVSLGIIICLISYFSLIFEYNLSRKNFISSSITNRLDNKSYNDTITISLDTSESSLSRFKELNGTTLKINYLHNNKYLEDYNTVFLNINDDTYKWERYYKDKTMIAKSPFYGQYIIIENYKDLDYSFKEGQSIDTFINSFRKFISKTNNLNYSEATRLNVAGNNSFIDYLKQVLLLSSNYQYYYRLEKNSQAQKLFNNIFEIFTNSSNFDSFNKEEKDIQHSLSMSDSLEQSKTILTNIVKNSKVTNTDVNLKIEEKNQIKIVDINFSLEYKDDTMANSVPMNIRFTCEFNNLGDSTSLEEDSFTSNACFYDSLGK